MDVRPGRQARRYFHYALQLSFREGKPVGDVFNSTLGRGFSNSNYLSGHEGAKRFVGCHLLVWSAPFARSEPFFHSIGHLFNKHHIFWAGCSGGASKPAENSSRGHSIKADPGHRHSVTRASHRIASLMRHLIFSPSCDYGQGFIDSLRREAHAPLRATSCRPKLEAA